jgi:mannose-6-phosphate isomerase-like protein (cupin superfamily)
MKHLAITWLMAMGMVLTGIGVDRTLADEIKVIRADNIYAKGTAECPDAVVTANGDIIVVFANHGDVQPGAESLFIRSSDGGKTWSDVYLKIGADDPSETGTAVYDLFKLDNGHLLAARTDIYMPGGQLSKHQTTRLNILQSTDNGKTFNKISSVKFPKGELAAPYGPMVKLADGSIIMPGFIQNVGNGYWQTRDSGKTWSDFRVVWQDPPEGVKQHLWFNETAYEVLKDGSIVAIARNDVNDLFYRIESKDNGRTWSKPLPLAILGGSPALQLMADGSLIIAIRDAGRVGLNIYQSHDAGNNWRYLFSLQAPEGVPALPNQRWDRPKVDQSWQPGEGHTGYPAIVELPDGNVYVISHVHNIHSPPAAPGRDTYGLMGHLISNPKNNTLAGSEQVFPMSQIGAILRAQIISGPAAAPALIDASAGGGLQMTPQRIENRTSNDAEVHQDEDDIFYILDGGATFHLGGTLHDTWTYSPGNQAGHEQKGAREYVVGPGDVVFVPRGTVHRITCPDGFVEVLMIKRSESK